MRWVSAVQGPLVVTALMMGGGTAQAQSIPPLPSTSRNSIPTLGLEAALRYARLHHPALSLAKARLARVQAEASIPDGAWSPRVGATGQVVAGTANNTTAAYFPDSALGLERIGGSRANHALSGDSLLPRGSTLLALGVNQRLFDFGRTAALHAVGDALIAAERERFSESGLDVGLSVEESYFAVLAAKGVVSAAQAALRRVKWHDDFTREQVTHGLRPAVDMTRSAATLAKAQVGEVRARGALATAQSIYAAAVGLDYPLLDAPESKGEPKLAPSLAEAVARAVGAEPRLRAAQLRTRALGAAAAATGAELRPILSAMGSLSTRAGGAPASDGSEVTGEGWVPWVPNWNVGLGLSWAIADGVVSARQHAIESAESESRAEFNLVKQEVVTRVRVMYYRYELTRDSIPALVSSLDAARKNQEQTAARYDQGLATAVELADAEELLVEAELSLVQGRFELARARSILGREMGELR